MAIPKKKDSHGGIPVKMLHDYMFKAASNQLKLRGRVLFDNLVRKWPLPFSSIVSTA